MKPKNRRPVHPGEILLTEFLVPLKLSQVELSERLSVPIQRINTIIRGKRGVSAETALLLSREFGTTPQFWLNLQMACDLYDAEQRLSAAA
jgi:addiction module HigA family antidote